jgi:hypothetical protein
MPSRSPDPRKQLLDIRDNIRLAHAFIEGVDYIRSEIIGFSFMR